MTEPLPVSQHGFPTDVFGPPLHFVMKLGAQDYPEHPTDPDRSEMEMALRSLPAWIPCKKCKQHYRETFQQFFRKDMLASRTTLVRAMYDLHNLITKNTGENKPPPPPFLEHVKAIESLRCTPKSYIKKRKQGYARVVVSRKRTRPTKSIQIDKSVRITSKKQLQNHIKQKGWFPK